jgi:Cd2+/Zn2+-exporting ATPase
MDSDFDVTLPGLTDDDSCADVLKEAISTAPGILNARLDTMNEQVLFDYDPHLIADPEIAHLARRMTPAVQKRFETCTLRLGRQGGRACETCALAIEKRVNEIEGVRRATASYIGGVLSVTYDNALLSPDDLARHVRQLGVPLAPPFEKTAAPEVTPASAEGNVDDIVKRFRLWLTAERLEVTFTAITFIAMMSALIGERLGGPPLLETALYAIAYVAGGAFGLKAGIESLRHFTMDIDLLMVLAAVGAWLVDAPFEGAMLLFLFSLSNVLQAYALDRTRNAIRALMKLRPEQALARRGGRSVILPIEQIVIGDRLIVRPGERLPLDGVVIEGESSLDQSPITGESIPVAKRAGDEVLAGTINQNGGLEVRVTKLAKDSTIAKMIKLVEEAHSEKAQAQRFIDKFEQYYAWAVIGLTAALIIVPPLALNENFNVAFYRAMTAMVAASPCALVISTPASILSAIGNGARRGVLFKGGVHLEQAATIQVVAFDKTGTLTQGKPQVTDVLALNDESVTADQLLSLAAAVEAKSEHPLAQSIVKAASDRRLRWPEAQNFQAESGKGARATVNGERIGIGSLRYFERFRLLGLEAASTIVAQLQDQGKTSVAVARFEPSGETVTVLGVIAVADVLRPEAASVVRELKSLGIKRVVMLTGDNRRVAKAIAMQAGVDEVYADLLPEDKVRIIKEIKTHFGPVVMVGDGVNDAPALATATLGAAMGAAGTDVAMETADVVLMANNLRNIAYMIALGRAARRTLIVNLGFALFMIALMLAGIFAIRLPLPLAVVGHEGGTVLVSLNGLRLLAYRN